MIDPKCQNDSDHETNESNQECPPLLESLLVGNKEIQILNPFRQFVFNKYERSSQSLPFLFLSSSFAMRSINPPGERDTSDMQFFSMPEGLDGLRLANRMT